MGTTYIQYSRQMKIIKNQHVQRKMEPWFKSFYVETQGI